MKRIIKLICAIFGVLLSIILFIWITLVCVHFNLGDVDFEEENGISLMISKEETPTGRTISGILSSQEDLQRYLASRAYYHLPFEGNLTIELFDFENYDYIFSEGCSIIQMQKLLWDQCSIYDNTGLMPVLIIYGEHISHKVYIYKIKPKNKYREECG